MSELRVRRGEGLAGAVQPDVCDTKWCLQVTGSQVETVLEQSRWGKAGPPSGLQQK